VDFVRERARASHAIWELYSKSSLVTGRSKPTLCRLWGSRPYTYTSEGATRKLYLISRDPRGRYDTRVILAAGQVISKLQTRGRVCFGSCVKCVLTPVKDGACSQAIQGNAGNGCRTRVHMIRHSESFTHSVVSSGKIWPHLDVPQQVSKTPR
jgi:hypothetical protein